MNPEQDTIRALRRLAEGDRDKESPPEMEARLRRAFRRHRSVRRWRQISAWAIAAAVVIVMIATYARGPKVEPVRKAPAPEAAGTVPVPAGPLPAVPDTLSPDLLPPDLAPPAPRFRARNAIQREIVTEFFPLMDIAPPIERGELVRVSLPAAAMRSVGLPVREDRLAERVQADVLMSEEGLATAIRFIKISQ